MGVTRDKAKAVLRDAKRGDLISFLQRQPDAVLNGWDINDNDDPTLIMSFIDYESKFLQNQGAGAAGNSGTGSTVVYKHPKLHFSDDNIEAALGRMSRVMLPDGQCIGCVSRITDKGLCVGATHVHVDGDGNFLDATAFNGFQLQLLASFPYYDIIFLQGPPGPAFEWTTQALFAPPQEVMMLAYPRAPEKDLKTTQAHETHGRITLVAVSLELAAADYHGAMPNSSGGSVLFNSKLFAGVHLGTPYHKDETHHQDQEEQDAPESRIDMDPDRMWPRATDNGQGGAKRRRSSGALANAQLDRLEKLVMHSVVNIKHKDQVALFVPAPFVAGLARRAHLVGEDPLRQPISRLSNRS